MRHASSAISLVLILLLLLSLAVDLGVVQKYQCSKSDLGERYIVCVKDGLSTTWQRSFEDENK